MERVCEGGSGDCGYGYFVFFFLARIICLFVVIKMFIVVFFRFRGGRWYLGFYFLFL